MATKKLSLTLLSTMGGIPKSTCIRTVLGLSRKEFRAWASKKNRNTQNATNSNY